MARKKSLFKVPFLKVKINNKTIINLLGFACIGLGIMMLLSFFHLFSPDVLQGKVLSDMNQFLLEKFGGLSVFTPFVVLLFAGHFFNSKKVKLVKLNVSLGMLLMFIAMLGIFHTGAWGSKISENLVTDFSGFGAGVILFIALIAGIVLFFDTSIDVFILVGLTLSKGFVHFFKNHVFRGAGELSTKKLFPEKKKTAQDQEFIEDRKTEEKKTERIISSPKPSPAVVPANLAPAHEQQPANKDLLNIRTTRSTANTTWIYPPLSLLADISQKEAERGDVNRNADTIEKTLDSFGIRARVAEVNKGPTVTQYALSITMVRNCQRLPH